MGCWQETCALTHVPIYEGDRCVVVVMSELFTQLYDRNPDMGRFRSADDFKHVESVLYGTYNDYGWINELDDEVAPDRHGVNRVFSQRRITAFFHEKVWTEAVKAGWEAALEWEAHRLQEVKDHRAFWPDPSMGPQAPTQDMVMFRAVYEVAYWTRRDLMLSHYFHGCQSWENHYYDLVHGLTSKMWRRVKKREKE